jgi:hypothetical protein
MAEVPVDAVGCDVRLGVERYEQHRLFAVDRSNGWCGPSGSVVFRHQSFAPTSTCEPYSIVAITATRYASLSIFMNSRLLSPPPCPSPLGRRIGIAELVVVAGLCYGLGTILAGQAHGSIGSLYLTYGLLGGIGLGLGYMVPLATPTASLDVRHSSRRRENGENGRPREVYRAKVHLDAQSGRQWRDQRPLLDGTLGADIPVTGTRYAVAGLPAWQHPNDVTLLGEAAARYSVASRWTVLGFGSDSRSASSWARRASDPCGNVVQPRPKVARSWRSRRT